MATPRSQLIDSESPQFYHLVSRCVRRSWLCGADPVSGQNYEHRRGWLEERLLQLADCFAIDLYGFAIMSNHFHLLIRFDPNVASQWSDQEVADRWIRATNVDEDVQPDYRDEFLSSPTRVRRARETLGSLSLFMKHLKQPIAWRANREDNCTGHFFEGRFYSGLLLSEEDIIEALSYVDLNPVRAKIVKHAIEASHTSVALRLRRQGSNKKRLEEYLGPIVAGTRSHADKKINNQPAHLNITVRGYLDYLALYSTDSATLTDKQTRWIERLSVFRNKQRAFGTTEQLKKWAIRNGWSLIGIARD